MPESERPTQPLRDEAVGREAAKPTGNPRNRCLGALVGPRWALPVKGAGTARGVEAVLVGDRCEPAPVTVTRVPEDEAEHRRALELPRLQDLRQQDPGARPRDVAIANELEVRHGVGWEALGELVASRMRDESAIEGPDVLCVRVDRRGPGLNLM